MLAITCDESSIKTCTKDEMKRAKNEFIQTYQKRSVILLTRSHHCSVDILHIPDELIKLALLLLQRTPRPGLLLLADLSETDGCTTHM